MILCSKYVSGMLRRSVNFPNKVEWSFPDHQEMVCYSAPQPWTRRVTKLNSLREVSHEFTRTMFNIESGMVLNESLSKPKSFGDFVREKLGSKFEIEAFQITEKAGFQSKIVIYVNDDSEELLDLIAKLEKEAYNLFPGHECKIRVTTKNEGDSNG